ncbi:MAG: hypothetical protein ACN4GZ_03485, partial [Acidimicrobiales bacterium]
GAITDSELATISSPDLRTSIEALRHRANTTSGGVASVPTVLVSETPTALDSIDELGELLS